jgi:3-hydroxyisobutyrate dehydrogenase
MRIGVIGLGAMGLAMAGTLARAGFSVMGSDLSANCRQAAAAAGLALAENGAILAEADAVVLSLPDATAVRAVLSGSAALKARSRPLAIIDTSTSEPAVSRALEMELGSQGHHFLDAPVSGGPSGAAAGTLTFMVGGRDGALDAARPVLDALGRKIVHVGGPGAGNVVKLINNMLVACHMITTREALRLAEASGVEVASIFAAVNGATGRSAISEIHYPTWVLSDRFDSGFSAGLMRKDLRLALEMAGDFGVAAPYAAHAAALWAGTASGLSDTDDFTRIARAADGRRN